MRAFIAITLPDDIRTELARGQAALREALEAEPGGDAGVRWAAPESIHLTIKFLGEITAEKSRELVEALDFPFPRFGAEVRGLGFFPDSKRPRVLWAGVVAGLELIELARKVEAVTQGLGFPAEDRSFSPHLTLARFRDARPQPALQIGASDLGARSLGRFQVSEFCLFESRLAAGKPAEHRIIACLPRHQNL
ncbi:MAG: RNA 2',3'-cyclic phosphodiesterase [Terriglobia bacterium]